MQNNSTGMLATSVPVDVVPNAPRWPSWKIQTSAPNAAVRDKHVEQQCFQWKNDAAGQQEQQHERDRGDDRRARVGSRDVIAWRCHG